jgi:hypothetical protein
MIEALDPRTEISEKFSTTPPITIETPSYSIRLYQMLTANMYGNFHDNPKVARSRRFLGEEILIKRSNKSENAQTSTKQNISSIDKTDGPSLQLLVLESGDVIDDMVYLFTSTCTLDGKNNLLTEEDFDSIEEGASSSHDDTNHSKALKNGAVAVSVHCFVNRDWFVAHHNLSTNGKQH